MMGKDLILQTISATCFAKKKKNQRNWARPGNFDICFCVTLNAIAKY